MQSSLNYDIFDKFWQSDYNLYQLKVDFIVLWKVQWHRLRGVEARIVAEVKVIEISHIDVKFLIH